MTGELNFEEYLPKNELVSDLQSILSDPNCPLFVAATVEQIILEKPAASVPVLVYCNECQYSVEASGKRACNRPGIPGLMPVEDYDFCSRGKSDNEE